MSRPKTYETPCMYMYTRRAEYVGVRQRALGENFLELGEIFGKLLNVKFFYMGNY